MEYDLLIRHHNQLMRLAQELASASEALAASMAGDEAAIPAPTACDILTNLMDALMTLSRTLEGLRLRLVASLYSSRIILTDTDTDTHTDTDTDLATDETHDQEESVLAADADIFSSATSLDLAERCLSSARNAIATQLCNRANKNPAATSRGTQ